MCFCHFLGCLQLDQESNGSTILKHSLKLCEMNFQRVKMLKYLDILYHYHYFNRNPYRFSKCLRSLCRSINWERSWSLLFRLPELFGVSELSKSSRATISKDKLQESLKHVGSKHFTSTYNASYNNLTGVNDLQCLSSLNLHDIVLDAPRLESASSAPHPAISLLSNYVTSQELCWLKV